MEVSLEEDIFILVTQKNQVHGTAAEWNDFIIKISIK